MGTKKTVSQYSGFSGCLQSQIIIYVIKIACVLLLVIIFICKQPEMHCQHWAGGCVGGGRVKKNFSMELSA